ncbi:hypothetical protein ACJMK2_029283 [Sinanodonta woodiana]|uniref:Uncharacterized protein n=1 Tax=Sinanodonta woodiana TaxID=1069815 RepID=A0ABD3XDA7_SINWO
MTQSREQGLLAKKEDLSNTLLIINMFNVLFSKYVRCWCKTNNLKAPEDTKINEALTELAM